MEKELQIGIGFIIGTYLSILTLVLFIIIKNRDLSLDQIIKKYCVCCFRRQHENENRMTVRTTNTENNEIRDISIDTNILEKINNHCESEKEKHVYFFNDDGVIYLGRISK